MKSSHYWVVLRERFLITAEKDKRKKQLVVENNGEGKLIHMLQK